MSSVQVNPRQEGDLQSLLQVVSKLFECPVAGWDEDVVLEEYLDWLPDVEVGDRLRYFWNVRKQLTLEELWLHYVDTFELQENAPLYLTLPLYKNPLERSLALQRLRDAYRMSSSSIPMNELADYLPAVFEFAAVVPLFEGARVLLDLRPGLLRLEQQLLEQGSFYADAAKAALTLADRVIQRGGGTFLQSRAGRVFQ